MSNNETFKFFAFSSKHNEFIQPSFVQSLELVRYTISLSTKHSICSVTDDTKRPKIPLKLHLRPWEDIKKHAKKTNHFLGKLYIDFINNPNFK